MMAVLFLAGNYYTSFLMVERFKRVTILLQTFMQMLNVIDFAQILMSILFQQKGEPETWWIRLRLLQTRVNTFLVVVKVAARRNLQSTHKTQLLSHSVLELEAICIISNVTISQCHKTTCEKLLRKSRSRQIAKFLHLGSFKIEPAFLANKILSQYQRMLDWYVTIARQIQEKNKPTSAQKNATFLFAPSVLNARMVM